MVILPNKKRFPITFIAGLIVLVLIGLLFINTIKHYNENQYNNNIYLITFTGLSIWVLTFTIFSLLDYLKTTFDNKTALTITDKGINDNLSIFSVGNINWTEITDIRIETQFNINFLVIDVNNPQLFIERVNKFKQRPLKSFAKKFGSPVVISQKRIDYDINDLKELLIKAKTKD